MADPWEGLRRVTARMGPGGMSNGSEDMGMTGGRSMAPSSVRTPIAASNGGGFGGLLDPEAGGIFGLLGRMTGAPTRQERMMQRLGESRGRATQEIMSRVAAGMQPAAAVVDFVNTPEGMQTFMNDPEALSEMATLVKMATPETKDMMNIAPGGAVFDPNTKQQIFNNPTSETQNLRALTQMGNLSDQEKEKIARAQLEVMNTQDPTQAEAAVKRLVAAGSIDQTTGDMMLSGILQIKPLLNNVGETTGYVVVNGATGEVKTLAPGEMTTPDPTGGAENDLIMGPPAPPGSARNKAEIEAGSRGNPVSADIVEGAGATPMVTEIAGGVAGQAFPGLSGRDATAKRNALKTIVLDAQKIRDSGRVLADELKKVDAVVGRLTSVMTNPVQAAQILLDWHDFLDRHEAVLQTQAASGASNETKKNAIKDLDALTQARTNMPSREELQLKIKQLETGPGQIQEGIKKGLAAEKEIEDAVRPQADNKPQTFKSEADLAAAAKAGKLQVGQKVIVNGEEVEIAP